MLDFKKLLGDKYKDDLSDAEKLALLNELNLADLNTGDYVAKGKFEARESEVARLNKLVAEYQTKEKEGLTNEQRKDVEYKELVKKNEELAKKVADFEFLNEIRKSGYTEDECQKIITARNEGKDTVSVYAEIMKSRIEESVKSTKAEMLKSTTPPPPQGSDEEDDGQETDPILKMVKEAAQGSVENTSHIEEVKNAYKITE